MVVYDSAAIYIDSCASNEAKIAAIDNIINTLMTTAATAAADQNITEYTLNDGQTQIKASYRSVDSIFNSINSFEKLKQMYINRLNGRVVRLVDGKNFTRRRGPYGR
jgi:hypothetical protein